MEALIGIAPGAGLAWLSAAYGQRRAQRAEHDKWLRERRFEAWTEMLSALETQRHWRIGMPPEEQLAEQSKLRVTIAQMTLLGPGTVVTAVQKLHSTCVEFETSQSADEKRPSIRRFWDADADFVKSNDAVYAADRRAGLPRGVRVVFMWPS